MNENNAKLVRASGIAALLIGVAGAVVLFVIGQPVAAGLFAVIALAGLVMVPAATRHKP